MGFRRRVRESAKRPVSVRTINEHNRHVPLTYPEWRDQRRRELEARRRR